MKPPTLLNKRGSTATFLAKLKDKRIRTDKGSSTLLSPSKKYREES